MVECVYVCVSPSFYFAFKIRDKVLGEGVVKEGQNCVLLNKSKFGINTTTERAW